MVWAGAIAPVEGGAEQHEAPQHRHRVKLLLKINHNSIIQKMLGVSTRTKASSTAGIVIVIVIIIIIII